MLDAIRTGSLVFLANKLEEISEWERQRRGTLKVSIIFEIRMRGEEKRSMKWIDNKNLSCSVSHVNSTVKSCPKI